MWSIYCKNLLLMIDITEYVAESYSIAGIVDTCHFNRHMIT